MKDLKEIINAYSPGQYIAYNDIIRILNEFETNFTSFMESLGPSKVHEFVYWNCHRFNRFSVPTPFVLEKDSNELFERFLNVFSRIETTNINTACLHIDKLMWEAFDLISDRGYMGDLIPIIRSLRSIRYPENREKLKEFRDHKAKLKAYISGYLNSNLVTKIETIIPVSPVEKQTMIKSVYKDVQIEILLSPTFYDTPQSAYSGLYFTTVPLQTLPLIPGQSLPPFRAKPYQ